MTKCKYFVTRQDLIKYWSRRLHNPSDCMPKERIISEVEATIKDDSLIII